MIDGPEKQSFGNFLRYFRGQTINRKTGRPLSQDQFGIHLTDRLGLIITRNKVNHWETDKNSPHPQRERDLLIAIITTLKDFKGIRGLDEANRLLQAGNYQSLTTQEINRIDPTWNPPTVHQDVSGDAVAKTVSVSHSDSTLGLAATDFQPKDIYHYFQASPVDLRLSFDSYIADKIKGFVGREFVFDAIDDFIKNNLSGYLIIRGEPGIGKTAMLAKLIYDHGYVHHFNIALQNIRSVKTFLENICLQLIARYDLPYSSLPQSATENSNFLSQCLSEAAAKRENHPIVIAVDALDESDSAGLPAPVNSLYLPFSLPEGVYIVVTVRRIFDLRLQVSNRQTLDLEADSDGNLQDIKDYIENHLKSETMLHSVASWNVSKEQFTEVLAKKSQGNFMYLHHVLPAIERGKFISGGLDELPEGLLDYYQRHWRQMREGNEQDFDTLYEPIVCILGVAQEPITIEQMSNWTKLDKGQVNRAIEKWYEFLSPAKKDQRYLYRIYHVSFQEFLASKVDLTKYDRMIADYYLGLTGMK